MLQTLLKIGKWQSQGKSKWDRFLDIPKVQIEDKKESSIKNYTLPIVFDLDNQKVIIDKLNLEEYDEKKIVQVIPLKIKGGNNKAIYTAVPSKKLNQIYKTFFGKEGNEEAQTGELEEAILKLNPGLLTKSFKNLLDQIFLLKDQFLELTLYTKKNGNQEVDIKKIEETFEMNKNEKLIFVIVKVKSEEFGFDEPALFSEILDYTLFLDKSFFKENKTQKNAVIEKLCYASGNVINNVEGLDLNKKYSLNKMFVTTTKNYASDLNDKFFHKNYQVNTQNQEFLDYASDFLLYQGYKVRIANIDHVIIPQFLSTTSEMDLEIALEGIQRKSDLLFNFKKLTAFYNNIKDWLDNEDEIFWINFFAFESDGNFFKSTEVIKDVSSFHFNKLLNCFYEVNKQFQNYSFVNWESVMGDYGKPRDLNFNSLYQIIPLRKDKEKKNKALDLIKTILENRKVEKNILFDYSTELILCHYYERYNSYTNVWQYGKDYFHIAIRDSVFKYLAFFEFLKKLNLIDMEEQNKPAEDFNQYDQLEKEFFERMNLNQKQRAMFYLGRMLNSVEYLQQGKNKTVIQKVNFNGMDKDSIQRLRIDLIEKAKQYNAMSKVIFTDQKFGNEFDYNNWGLRPREATFFLLTGYSFGAGKKNETNN